MNILIKELENLKKFKEYVSDINKKISPIVLWSAPQMLDKNLTFGGVFFMSKYSNEFKLEVVKYCIEKHHGYKDASKHFGIPSHENIRQWCKKYELYGPEGILKNLRLIKKVKSIY